MLHGWKGMCWKWCHNPSLGQLLLRLALGSYFIGHAVAKLQSLSGTVVLFGQWGIAPFWAYVATFGELFAGIAFVLGIFSWIAALIIVVDMIVAVWVVIGPNPNSDPALFHFIFGWGPNAIYAAAALAIAFTGVGQWSLAAWLTRRWPRLAGYTE